jgi:hypothetical protein
MIETETMSPALGDVPVLVATVIVEELVNVPVNPWMLAVIWMVPGPVEVTSPVEFTVATSDDPVLHVTRSVTFSVVEGWLP